MLSKIYLASCLIWRAVTHGYDSWGVVSLGSLVNVLMTEC